MQNEFSYTNYLTGIIFKQFLFLIKRDLLR